MSSSTTNHEIVYTVLTEDHLEEAAQILTITFINGEPLSSVVKQPYDVELAVNRMICRKAAQDGVSVVAIDKELNKVVEVAVGTIMELTENKSMLDTIKHLPDEAKPYYIVFALLAEKLEPCFFQSPHLRDNPDCKILKSIKLSVHPDYEGRGVATKMADMRRDLAEKKNLKFIILIATAVGSQKVYTKLGYKDIGELPYKDFTHNDEIPFAGITIPPSAKAMILQVF